MVFDPRTLGAIPVDQENEQPESSAPFDPAAFGAIPVEEAPQHPQPTADGALAVGLPSDAGLLDRATYFGKQVGLSLVGAAEPVIEAGKFVAGAPGFIGEGAVDIASNPLQSVKAAASGFQSVAGGMAEGAGILFRGTDKRQYEKLSKVLADDAFMATVQAKGGAIHPESGVFVDADRERDRGGFWGQLGALQKAASENANFTQPNALEMAGQSAKDAASRRIAGLDKDFAEGPGGMIMQGLGSTGAVLGGQAFRAPGMLVSSGLAMGSEQVDDRRQVLAENGETADIEGDLQALFAGAALAPTEFIPISRALARASKLSKTLSPGKQYTKDILLNGAEEGITELMQGVGKNLNASEILSYDEARGLFSNVTEESYAGMGAGALFQAILGLPSYRAAKQNIAKQQGGAHEDQPAPADSASIGLPDQESQLQALNNQGQPDGSTEFQEATSDATPIAAGLDKDQIPTPEQEQQVGQELEQQPDATIDVSGEARPVLQNRDRSTPASITQMNAIASNPDYGRLGFSRDFANGSPVVEEDAAVSPRQIGRQDYAVSGAGRRIPVRYAVVEADQVLTSNAIDGTANPDYAGGVDGRPRAIAGNGRLTSLQQAYRDGNADAYRQELLADLSMYGLDESALEGVQNPVLVRLMPKDQITANIGDESNVSGVSALSPAEAAKNDMRRLDIAGVEFGEDGQITADAVRQFVRAMPEPEQAGLLDGGQPSRQAFDRLANAVFAGAYDSDALVRLQAQAADPEARNIMNALLAAAPKMARLKEGGEHDIRPIITQAAEAAVNARRSGQPLSEFLKQGDMAANPDIVPVLEVFAGNIRSSKRIAEKLSDLADAMYAEASKPEKDMFGELSRRPAQQIIQEVLNGEVEENRAASAITTEAARSGESAQAGGASQRQGPAPVREDAAGPVVPDRSGLTDTPVSTETPANAGVSVSGVMLRNDGKPYKTEKAAQLSITSRKLKDHVPVEVDGGWGIQPPQGDMFGRTVEQESAQQIENAKSQKSERQKRQSEQAAKVSDGPLFDGSQQQADIDRVANEAATSPQNDLPAPTEAQIEAGNYKKGHVPVQGLDITIENPRGSTRSGTDPDGNKWEQELAHHYGYIKRTQGADGEHVDVFIGPDVESTDAFVIDQVNADGTFDEHKIMLGFKNQKAARDGYRANYQDGWVVGKTTKVPVSDLKAWLETGDLTKPFSGEAKATAPEHSAQHDDLAGIGPDEMRQMVKAFEEAGAIESAEGVTSIFDAPKKGEIVRLADKVRVHVGKHGWMTPAQAKKVIAEWKENAAKQYEENRSENNGKVVLSFFDYTGEWSKPWEEAGYEVWRFDIQHDADMGDVNNFSVGFFNDWFSDFDGKDVYAILAACPCTDFASSGARHFAAKDADGRTIKSIRLVRQTLAAIEYFKPAVWALENPVGRIEKLGGLPPWRLSFDPNHLGEDYTKKTLIWGRFNADLPIAPAEPTAGSKMHTQFGGSSMATKNARSATPEGFSYAFFQANNAVDNPAMALANKYDQLARPAIEGAINAGLTPAEIAEIVDDYYYMDLDYEGANSALRAATEERLEQTEPGRKDPESPREESSGKPSSKSTSRAGRHEETRQKARELIGLKEGDQFTLTEDFDYMTAGTVYEVVDIDGSGSVQVRNVERGSGTLLSLGMLMAAKRRGIAFQQQAGIEPAGKNEKIEDLGEKIGGARKDTAISTGKRESSGVEADSRPAWAKRFEVVQIAKSIKAEEEGRWVINDTRKKGFGGSRQRAIRETFATKEEAESAIPLIAVSMKHRLVSTNEGGYEIWRTVSDRKRVKVVDRVFPSRDEAMKYMALNASEIIAVNTTFGEADIPLPPDRARSGKERRKGDVQGQDFMDSFGLRAVEFGNWNNQAERQNLLNDAYDGLMDLADVLNIPPRAIGLNGDLALAFGARGHGLASAKAHYEPDRAVINLTKERGAGSLAHEWFHALDHYLGRQDGKAIAEWKTGENGERTLDIRGPDRDFVSHGFRGERSGVRQEVREAYARLMRTISKKAEQYVEDTVRADTFVGAAKKDLEEALARLREDLAREHQYKKRNNKPASGEQLAEFDTIASELLAGNGLKTEARTIEGAKKHSFASIRVSNDSLDALSKIFKAVRGSSGFTADRGGVLDRIRGYMERYASRLKMLDEANNGEAKTRHIPTDFAMEAKELDQGRGSEYWTTPHEMAARAFQSYVEDKIAESGGVSRFLTYGPEGVGILTPWGVKMPFPSGAERKAINSALDDLVAAFRTRETDSGVALFSMSEGGDAIPDATRRIIADDPLLTAWTTLAMNDDAFQLPISKKASIKGIVEEQIPGATVEPADRDYVALSNATDGWLIKMPDGKGGDVHAYVFQKGNSVWINVADYMPGQGGRRIYNAVANYAFNRNKVFIGDPDGLSEIALTRRLENMISSGLKFGTTRHLWPHPDQEIGSDNVPGLNWRDGEDAHNLRQMIQASYTATISGAPEIAGFVYNPETDRFEDTANGNAEVTRKDFDSRAKEIRALRGHEDGGGEASPFTAGGRTLERAVLTHTILRRESEEGGAARRFGRSLLDRLGRLGSQRLVGDNAILYSNTTEARPSAGLSASGLRGAIRKALGEKLAGSVKVVQSVTDLPPISGVESLAGVDAAYKDAAIHYEEMRSAFLNVMEEDADGVDVMDAIDDFPAPLRRVLQALHRSDWLGFDYPSQALDAIFSEDAAAFEMTPGLKSALGTFVNAGTGLYSSASARIEGMYDPASGDVYLVADSIGNEDRAAWVAWHELFHRGIRSAPRDGAKPFGQDAEGLRQTLNRAGLNKHVKALADAIAKDRNMRPSDRLIAIEEALAELNAADETGDYGQIQRRYGVSVPDGMKSGIRGHIAKFLDAVKRVLGGMLGRNTPVSDADVWRIVRGARAGYGVNGVSNGGPALSVAQEAVALPVDGDDARSTPPDESLPRRFQRRFQDKFNRFTVIRDWLKEQGITLSEGANVYRAEERMHGRVAAKVEDFRKKVVQPLVKEIQSAGYSMSQVAEFLHAQHARERNSQIAKVNKGMPDGGSGMSNAMADEILAKYSTEPQLIELANRFREITDATRQILFDAGIVGQDAVDAWSEAYKAYVPLKGGPDAKLTDGAGKGLTAKAKIKRALGHGEREGGEWIVENIMADHERAIMAAEKNLVARHLLQMIMEVGRDDLFTVGKPEKRGVLRNQKAYSVWYRGAVIGSFSSRDEAARFIDVTSSRMLNDGRWSFAIEESSDPSVVYTASPQLAPNEAHVYLNGHAVRIQFHDELLARAWNNLGQESVGLILGYMRELNTWLSKVYTGYNPEFLITNIVRDLGTGVANLTGEEGIGMAARAVASYPNTFAQLLKYAATGEASQLIDEFRADGGNTGAAWLSDLEKVGDDVRSAYDDAQRLSDVASSGGKGRAAASAWRRLVGKLLGWMEVINAAGENAMRLAAYKAMRDAGKSRNQAAAVSKNITVNFNRKGELGASLGAMYLFFNPAVQGTASIAHAHFKGKHKEQAWALSAGLLAAGFMYAMAKAGADDDEWESLTDYEKERHLMIRTSNGWVKIPIPYGHGWFWNTGRYMAELVGGKTEPDEAALRIAASFVGEFSVFGSVLGGGDLDSRNLLFLAPTIIQIPGAVAVNQTSFGAQVFPEYGLDGSRPDSQKMSRHTKGSVFETATSVMNELTGGDAIRAGAIDVSPETLKYLWRTFTGGSGSFVVDALNLPVMLAQGVEMGDLESREIPMLRRFYRNDSVADSRRRYWEAVEKAETAMEEFSRARRFDTTNRDSDLAMIKKYGLSQKELIAQAKMAQRFNKLVALKRDAQAAILADESKPLGWRRLKVKELEQEEQVIYERFFRAAGM